MIGAAEAARCENEYTKPRQHGAFIIYFYSFLFLLLFRLLLCGSQMVGSLHTTHYAHKNIVPNEMPKSEMGFLIQNLQMTRGCCLRQHHNDPSDAPNYYIFFYWFQSIYYEPSHQQANIHIAFNDSW